MPKRLATQKFTTTDVQGAGSWIVFKTPSWEEVKNATAAARDIGKRFRGNITDPDEQARFESATFDLFWDLAVTHFHEWNWVDGDGNPLEPLPDVDPDSLLSPEMEAIVVSVQRLFKMTEGDREKKPG